uniref:Metalloendopeptidase n=1 Tax=Graphocephala atropunctata TaxID=36148 RepID=A0A1B6M869_9HEMI
MLYVSTLMSTIALVVAFQQGSSTTERSELSEQISEENDSNLEHRSFLKDRRYLWPVTNTSAGPRVYIPYKFYYIEPRVETLVLYYIELFKNKSCIQWIPRTNERDFVRIQQTNSNDTLADPCYSNALGRKGGRQLIGLNTFCLRLNHTPNRQSSIPHEMMHALGFNHEQQRRDSRCYLNVSQEVENDKSYKVYRRKLTDIHFPYDFHSVMHYSGNKFVSLQGKSIGRRGTGPSWQDWWRINYLYCGAKHICEAKKALCEEHKRYLKQCYQDGRLVYDPSDKFLEITDDA